MSRIGIGCGNGIQPRDVAYAVESGVNYFFYSTDFHALHYSGSLDGILPFSRKGSARRHDVILAACSYVNDVDKIGGVLIDQMKMLKADYVDVFFWGWVTESQRPDSLLDGAHARMREHFAQQQDVGVAQQVGQELRSRGYARFLGISTHDRGLARSLLGHPNLDALMLRYNISHRGADAEIFPFFGAKRPGIVSFNTTHDRYGSFMDRVPNWPREIQVPTAADLYRFSLDNANIDVVLAGPETRTDLESALEASDRPPLKPDVRQYLEAYGDTRLGRPQRHDENEG